MISKYLRSKKIIDYIQPIVDKEELRKNYSNGYYYLNTYPNDQLYYYYENLFNDEELKWIKFFGKNLPLEQATVRGLEVDTKIRSSYVSWVGVNDVTRWIYQKLTDCILEVNEVHFKYELEKIENLQFTYYSGKDTSFYERHLDTISNTEPTNRKLSFVLQLSDPSEYDGGELRLHIGSSHTVIKKQKGLITFFPSHTLHECSPVTSGERYVIVGWIHGPPFK
jgi:PKHD-type hydroxylase